MKTLHRLSVMLLAAVVVGAVAILGIDQMAGAQNAGSVFVFDKIQSAFSGDRGIVDSYQVEFAAAPAGWVKTFSSVNELLLPAAGGTVGQCLLFGTPNTWGPCTSGVGPLARVESDATLTSDGTIATPLAVAVPVTSVQVIRRDAIPAGAEVNVQSDWTETTTTSDAYINNKPTTLLIGLTYDLITNTISLTTATGSTITCSLNADCPAPAEQTLYLARTDTTTPTGAAFTNTNNSISVSATGTAPLALTLPEVQTGTLPGFSFGGAYVFIALPAALTPVRVKSVGSLAPLCDYALGSEACPSAIAVTIGGASYKALALSPHRLEGFGTPPFRERTTVVTWTE